MSVWSILGTALGGAAGFAIGGPVGALFGSGIGSSLGGSLDSHNAQKDANDTNLSISKDNNETSLQVARENISAQQAENEKSRQFSSEQLQREFDHQKAMWELETNYNSPLEQVKRLREAGLNPALIMNGNGASVSSQSMPSVPSAPSPSLGISPSMPVLQNGHVEPLPSIGLSQIDAIGRLLEAKKAFADANLSNSQKNQIDSMLDESLRGLMLDNDAKEMANTLQRDMLPLMKNMQGKRYMAEVAVLTKQAFMYEEQGNKAKSDAVLNEIIGKLREAETEVAKENRQLFHLQVEGYPEQLKATLRKMLSEANKNNAEARSISELLPYQKDVMSAQNALLMKDAEYRTEEIKQSAALRSKIAKECVILTKQAAKMNFDAERENELYEFYLQQIEIGIDQAKQDYYNPFHFVGQVLGGSGAAAIKAMAK